MCDAIIVQGKTARYLFDLPIDFVHSSHLAICDEYYTITFEWGKWDGDVFAIDRHPRSDRAYINAFLHPIIRHYSGGKLLKEHHVLEDLFGMYRAEGETGTVIRRSQKDMKTYHQQEHDTPLREFFKSEINLDKLDMVDHCFCCH